MSFSCPPVHALSSFTLPVRLSPSRFVSTQVTSRQEEQPLMFTRNERSGQAGRTTGTDHGARLKVTAVYSSGRNNRTRAARPGVMNLVPDRSDRCGGSADVNGRYFMRDLKQEENRPPRHSQRPPVCSSSGDVRVRFAGCAMTHPAGIHNDYSLWVGYDVHAASG